MRKAGGDARPTDARATDARPTDDCPTDARATGMTASLFCRFFWALICSAKVMRCVPVWSDLCGWAAQSGLEMYRAHILWAGDFYGQKERQHADAD